jgi:transcriptional regulator with XRE-family HTH domain
VNHKDGDKGNPDASNLEWCSPPENTAHAVAMGLWTPGEPPHELGEKSSHAVLTNEQATEILRLRGTESAASLARRFGVAKSTVKAVHTGQNWGWLETDRGTDPRRGRPTLTGEEVAGIRRRFAAGGITQAALAREIGVGPPLLFKLLTGATYRDAPGPIIRPKRKARA